MSSSQHLLVLMSIIIGLGIRELLVGARAAAAAKPWRDLHVLPFAAGLLVLIALVQYWWYLFIAANREAWASNFFLFAASLLRPIMLFISAASVFPGPDKARDLQEHYMQNRAFIFVPLALFEIQNLTESAVNLGTLLHPAHIFHVLFSTTALALAVVSNDRLQKLLVALVLVLVGIFLWVFSLRLD